jgi:hypothetical protein
MAIQTWVQTIYAMPADAVAVTSTGEQLMVPNVVLPANYMLAGKYLRATMKGIISNIVTTPGTLTLRARWAGLTGTVLVASAALAQNVVAQTNDQIEIDFLIACRVGLSTNSSMFTSGKVFQGNAASGMAPFLMPASGNAVVTGLDTTIAQALSFTAQFSLTGNSLTINEYSLEDMS